MSDAEGRKRSKQGKTNNTAHPRQSLSLSNMYMYTCIHVHVYLQAVLSFLHGLPSWVKYDAHEIQQRSERPDHQRPHLLPQGTRDRTIAPLSRRNNILQRDVEIGRHDVDRCHVENEFVACLVDLRVSATQSRESGLGAE